MGTRRAYKKVKESYKDAGKDPEESEEEKKKKFAQPNPPRNRRLLGLKP